MRAIGLGNLMPVAEASGARRIGMAADRSTAIGAQGIAMEADLASQNSDQTESASGAGGLAAGLSDGVMEGSLHWS